MGRRDLGMAAGGPVRAVAPVQSGGDHQYVKRRGHEGDDRGGGFGHGRSEAEREMGVGPIFSTLQA